MKSFSAQVVGEGTKNLALEVRGVCTPSDEGPDGLSIAQILKISDLNPVPKGLRLDAVMFLIEEKMGLRLYWTKGQELIEILPLESRGHFDFTRIRPISSPKDIDGMAISAFNIGQSVDKSFLLLLDMEKQ